MSLALEQPQACTGASLGCSRARDILGSLRPRPEKTTCSFPYRFSEKNRNSGLVPGNRDPNQNPCEIIAKQKRDRDHDSQPRPRSRLNSQPQGATKDILEFVVFKRKLVVEYSSCGSRGFRDSHGFQCENEQPPS